MTDLLEVRDLKVKFGNVRAVDGVDLSVPPGPFGLGLVGESGSGKDHHRRARSSASLRSQKERSSSTAKT